MGNICVTDDVDYNNYKELVYCYKCGDTFYHKYGYSERRSCRLHDYDENDFINYVNADLNPDLNDKTIKCPLCRTDNSLDDIKNIKGYSEKCSVCYENNVNKYFSKCEHACVCSECLVKL